MKLYVFPPSPNARKVLATAHHLGLPFEMQMVDLVKGEQRKPEYLKLNPNGRMPTMVDGDFVLWESNAIMQYMAGKKGANGLWPADERKRLDISRWQFWELAHWTPACGTYIFEYLVKGILGGGGPDPAKVKEGEEKFHRCAAVLDGHLATREWLVGDGVTLADISVGVFLAFAERCNFPVEKYGHIRNWYDRLERLDAMKKTAPQLPM